MISIALIHPVVSAGQGVLRPVVKHPAHDLFNIAHMTYIGL